MSGTARQKKAIKDGLALPERPNDFTTPKPVRPRLVQVDVTVEQLAMLLATAAPKGLLIARDELAGWIKGMSNYHNESARAFFIEAYGGSPYVVERKTLDEPYIIPRLAVAVMGTIQPERLAQIVKADPDDGLLSRFLWVWPDPVMFYLSDTRPRFTAAINRLDKLRKLDLEGGEPIYVPMSGKAVELLENFGQDAQQWQQEFVGLTRSAYGKARGHVLRLSLVIEMLRWTAEDDDSSPPTEIGVSATEAAIKLVDQYFLRMAERVYSDAAVTSEEKNSATLAKWIKANGPKEVYVRDLQRKTRLPGLKSAEEIHQAAMALVDADWLKPPALVIGKPRQREAYRVNPALQKDRSK
jgi:hypothetical protein